MNLGIIQAHVGSTRLPGKVMKKIVDKEILIHVYDRCKRAYKIDKLIIATSINKENDIIEEICNKYKIECFRGSENDVLDRYYQCAINHKPNIVVRITSDCPLLEPKLIDYWIENMERDSVEFVEEEDKLYTGFGIDIFTMGALTKLKNNSKDPKQKEHVVGYYLEHKNEFSKKIYPLNENLQYIYRPYRLTLDTIEDFNLIKFIYEKFYNNNYVDLKEVINHIDENIDILNVNSEIKQRKYNEI